RTPNLPIFTRFGPRRCYPKDSRPQLADFHLADQSLRLAPHQIDAEQPVLEVRRLHLDAVRQHERAAELSRGDAAVNVLSRLVVLLSATDDELVVLHHDLELIAPKACHRQGDAQPIAQLRGRASVCGRICRDALDVVGWIAVAALAYAVDQSLHLLEAQEQRARKQ